MLAKSPFAFLLVLSLSTTHAARVQFYTTRSCSGPASFEFRDTCNHCYDPPGDWFAVQFSEIDSNQRVSNHNQNSCTPASSVGQTFGPACFVAGKTAIRSAWVACAGQRLNAQNNTELNKSSTIPTIIADDV